MPRVKGAPSKRDRQDAILAELRASPAIRILDLAVDHGVSTETIRRDLDALSAAGVLSRTYGGATGAPLADEPLLDDRYRQNAEQRQALGHAVATLVKDGDSLMIDAGSTTAAVARRLAAERNDLTVITTSFGVASALATNPSFRIRFCPGDYDAREGGVIGPDALDYLGRFRVVHALIGASRLDADGPSDFNAASVWIKRTMIRQADETILALDHTKFEQAAIERICALDGINWLATDSSPPEDLATALEQANVEVRVA